MRVLHILSATSAAGKTVWAVGLVRALREAGFRVAVFKAVSEDDVGYEVTNGRVSLAAFHLMAAAGISPSSTLNPVLLLPTGTNRSEVWLLGRRVGDVPRLGRDMALLDELAPIIQSEVEQVTLTCLEETAKDADIVISEGSGGATDLALLGAWDLANVTVARRATAAVLVARASQGGALASLAGTAHLMHEEVRSKLRGLALNDVRHRVAEVVEAGRLVASTLGFAFLGATPWLAFFDGRPKYAPFTSESDEDHLMLAQAIRDSVNLPQILEWMNLPEQRV